ncbi:MAG: hypothetical protein ACXVHX_26060, partial [Solirubrobacteraceae bacterium]
SCKRGASGEERVVLGALRVICLLAVLLSPAALRSVTVARVPILRLSWRMRKLRRDSVNLEADLAAAGARDDCRGQLTSA